MNCEGDTFLPFPQNVNSWRSWEASADNSVKLGFFTKTEDDIIKKNWEKFKKVRLSVWESLSVWDVCNCLGKLSSISSTFFTAIPNGTILALFVRWNNPCFD